jgi:hypothetical protein
MEDGTMATADGPSLFEGTIHITEGDPDFALKEWHGLFGSQVAWDYFGHGMLRLPSAMELGPDFVTLPSDSDS